MNQESICLCVYGCVCVRRIVESSDEDCIKQRLQEVSFVALIVSWSKSSTQESGFKRKLVIIVCMIAVQAVALKLCLHIFKSASSHGREVRGQGSSVLFPGHHNKAGSSWLLWLHASVRMICKQPGRSQHCRGVPVFRKKRTPLRNGSTLQPLQTRPGS